jgi:hypothetical protein
MCTLLVHANSPTGTELSYPHSVDTSQLNPQVSTFRFDMTSDQYHAVAKQSKLHSNTEKTRRPPRSQHRHPRAQRLPRHPPLLMLTPAAHPPSSDIPNHSPTAPAGLRGSGCHGAGGGAASASGCASGASLRPWAPPPWPEAGSSRPCDGRARERGGGGRGGKGIAYLETLIWRRSLGPRPAQGTLWHWQTRPQETYGRLSAQF